MVMNLLMIIIIFLAIIVSIGVLFLAWRVIPKDKKKKNN
jgi:hypothetical protein|tara:strand:- start:380 stop:496 length:117 start_codon:yes stop_codon:yes gene_type:complete